MAQPCPHHRRWWRRRHRRPPTRTWRVLRCAGREALRRAASQSAVRPGRKSNLTLNQGEYKAAYDKASRVSTYQIILPVKGAYQSIWQFAMQGLRDAVCFAG
jgi:hypothetical protein